MVNLWMKVSRKKNHEGVVLGFHHIPPNQEEEVNEAFWKQLKNVSLLQSLMLTGYTNKPDTCWEGKKKPRNF